MGAGDAAARGPGRGPAPPSGGAAAAAAAAAPAATGGAIGTGTGTGTAIVTGAGIGTEEDDSHYLCTFGGGQAHFKGPGCSGLHERTHRDAIMKVRPYHGAPGLISL